MAKVKKAKKKAKPESSTSTAVATVPLDVRMEQKRVAEMTPALRKEYVPIREARAAMLRGDIETWYRIGERVKNIMEQPNKYGTEGVAQIAEALGDLTASPLYEAARIVKTYDWPHLERLLGRASKVGLRIGISHIRALTYVKEPHAEERRTKLEEGLLKGTVTFKKIMEEVQRGRTAPTGTGTKAAKAAKTPNGACQQIRKFAEVFEKQADTWDTSLFDWVAEAPPERCTEALLASVKETGETLLNLHASIDPLLDKFNKAVARLEQVIERREELEQAADGKRPRRGTRNTHPTVTHREKPEQEVDEEPELESEEPEAEAPVKKKKKHVTSHKPRDEEPEAEAPARKPAATHKGHKRPKSVSPKHAPPPSAKGGKPDSVKERIARAKAAAGR
jgi:hypothetical protein